MGQPWGVVFGKKGVWAVTDWSKVWISVYKIQVKLVGWWVI